MRLQVLLAALLLAVLAWPLFAQEATREDFRDFCEAWKGRWVGEVTWVADWEAYGKRGEKVTAYFEGTVAEDGNAMIGRFFGGKGSASCLVFFDPQAKRIKWHWVNSGGGVSEDIVYRSGSQWMCKVAGSTPDGSRTEHLATITITDNGNTHTWTGSGTVDGKKTDDQHDVWRRVSK